MLSNFRLAHSPPFSEYLKIVDNICHCKIFNSDYIHIMHFVERQHSQTVFARSGGSYVARELPAPDHILEFPNCTWGRVEEICTPAYWAAQAWMWEIEEPEHFKLGKTLAEELIACLLGGYGIPAEVGLAAYCRVRAAFEDDPSRLESEAEIYELLAVPLQIAHRSVRYRFARQKAKYLAASMRMLKGIDTANGDKALRDTLTQFPGIGLKTASWIVRNWRSSDEVSILDVHILRAGRILGIFPVAWTVERHYLALELAFLTFARAISVRPSILDSVMWMNMRQVPNSLVREMEVSALNGYSEFRNS
jgi:N-glycosylase/DNA lyase